jgi:hypothetical protein
MELQLLQLSTPRAVIKHNILRLRKLQDKKISLRTNLRLQKHQRHLKVKGKTNSNKILIISKARAISKDMTIEINSNPFIALQIKLTTMKRINRLMKTLILIHK